MKKASILIILLSLCSVVFAKTTFLTQNFDSDWSNSVPPSDWTITNDSLGSSGWNKDSAGSHWSDNHSGYAEISNASKDKFLNRDLDSLISPIIDCNRFRNIVLRCSTFFQYIQGSDTAKIIGSIDGGITYPYTIRNYYGEMFPNALLESLDLNWASEKESVRIAWVFAGSITNIAFWCLDGVSLVGDSVYDTDASCIEILRPFIIQPPIACTVKVRVINLGKDSLVSFPVCCSIADFVGSAWYFQVTCDFLPPGETIDVNLTPVWNADVPLPYQARAWTEVVGDENVHNDTIHKNFSINSTEILSYCLGPVAGENFPVRDQGWGVKFTPSFYPAIFSKIECFLGADLPAVNFRYKIRFVDDDGINYTPGTTLYETDIIQGNVEWNYIFITEDTIFINDGSVYVFYIQTNDVPVAPLLFHDGSRTTSAQYYKYIDSTYVPDLPNGDWLLLLTVQYLNFTPFNNDVRTVYITNPDNEFVRRPFYYRTKVKARIENLGNNNHSNFAVCCSIQSYNGGWHRYFDIESVPFLGSGQAAIVEFNPTWEVVYNEQVNIIVTTLLPGDQNDLNNKKVKSCINSIGKFFNYDSITTGYSWLDSDSTGGPEYEWVEPIGANLATDIGDDTVFSVLLPFSFSYCDSVYNRAYISTNGFLSFINQPPSAPNNSIIPNIDIPNGGLYIFWDDLVLPNDQTAKIYYQTIGSAPNRKFIVTWYNIARKNGDRSQRLNFQVVLYENGNIIFQYKNVVCGLQSANFGKDATIGIENKDGAAGLLYLYGSETQTTNWPENKLSDQRVIKFYQPLWDVGPIAKLSPADSIVPGSVTPQFIINNYGTEVAESVRVYLTISPGSYNVMKLIPRLIAGKQDTILFPNWDVNTTGQYTLICSTNYSQDRRHQNNIMQNSLLVSKWILKAPIPLGPSITRVKNGALAYDFDYNKIYALKGGNYNEFWCYDIARNQWESLPRMPKKPSNKKPKAGCALTYSQGKIYALKGGNTSDFYEYIPREFDPTLADSLRWVCLAPIKDTVYAPGKKPKDGAGLVFSSIDGFFYAILGNNSKVLVKYDPGSDIWYHEAMTPVYSNDYGKIRDGGSITFYPPPAPDSDTLLYIFQGKNTKNLWRYDIRRHNWLVELCTIPYPKAKIRSGANSTCQTDLGIIYFFIGGNKQSVLTYNIGTNSFDSITPIPLGPDPRSGRLRTKVKKGAVIVATTNDLVYAFKSGNTNEFWVYAVGSEKDDFKSVIKTIILPENTDDNLIQINQSIQSTSSNNYLLINYTLQHKDRVDLKLYSITGELIETLCDQEQSSGNYQISLDGIGKHKEKLKGIYFIKGNIGTEQIHHKIVRL